MIQIHKKKVRGKYRYKAIVNYEGFTQITAEFDSREKAEAWADKRECSFECGDVSAIERQLRIVEHERDSFLYLKHVLEEAYDIALSRLAKIEGHNPGEEIMTEAKARVRSSDTTNPS